MRNSEFDMRVFAIWFIIILICHSGSVVKTTIARDFLNLVMHFFIKGRNLCQITFDYARMQPLSRMVVIDACISFV